MIIKSANKKQKEEKYSISWSVNVKCSDYLHQKISVSFCQMRKRFYDMKDSIKKYQKNSNLVH